MVFSGSMGQLNQWKGKRVRLEMMGGEVPAGIAGGTITLATHSGVGLMIEGELVMLYDDALVIKTGSAQKLVFAHAIRAIYEVAQP